MELTGTADGGWENILQRKKTANFNPMVQIPTADRCYGARRPSLIDFQRPDLEIFNDTASLIVKFNSDLGIFIFPPQL